MLFYEVINTLYSNDSEAIEALIKQSIHSSSINLSDFKAIHTGFYFYMNKTQMQILFDLNTFSLVRLFSKQMYYPIGLYMYGDLDQSLIKASNICIVNAQTYDNEFKYFVSGEFVDQKNYETNLAFYAKIDGITKVVNSFSFYNKDRSIEKTFPLNKEYMKSVLI